MATTVATRWLALSMVLAAAFLGSPAPAHAKAAPCAWDRGFNFTGYRYDAFSGTAATTSFDRMTDTHANAVAVVVTWYQPTRYATTIAPDPNRTPSDEGVIRMTREAKARGLKVLLRPNVDGVRQEWRGRFEPSNEAEWFSSWRRMVNHYADMGQALGVDILQIGSEFESLSGNADAWRRVVAEAGAIRRDDRLRRQLRRVRVDQLVGRGRRRRNRRLLPAVGRRHAVGVRDRPSLARPLDATHRGGAGA